MKYMADDVCVCMHEYTCVHGTALAPSLVCRMCKRACILCVCERMYVHVCICVYIYIYKYKYGLQVATCHMHVPRILSCTPTYIHAHIILVAILDAVSANVGLEACGHEESGM
jgi:hypothetical protein